MLELVELLQARWGRLSTRLKDDFNKIKKTLLNDMLEIGKNLNLALP